MPWPFGLAAKPRLYLMLCRLSWAALFGLAAKPRLYLMLCCLSWVCCKIRVTLHCGEMERVKALTYLLEVAVTLPKWLLLHRLRGGTL